MKKNIKITPVGIKGYQINERMKELMGIKPINENKSNIVVELTKMGPDGNAYAVIRENHEWYIKKSSKTTNLLAEDFKYIGGLMNKKSEAYPSYAKAIKHLNLKFRSLAEAYNYDGEINLFENDNLISESGVAGFSQMGGSGFSNEGNLEGNETTLGVEPEVGDKVIFIKNLELKSGGGVVYISAGKEGEVDETGIGFYGGIRVKLPNPENVMDDEMVYFTFNKNDYSGDYAVIKIEKYNGLNEEMEEEKEEMTEAEKAIDAMIEESDDELPTPPSEEETKANQVYESLKKKVQTIK